MQKTDQRDFHSCVGGFLKSNFAEHQDLKCVPICYVISALGIGPVIRVTEDEIHSLQFSQETSLRGYRHRNPGRSRHPSLGSADPGSCGFHRGFSNVPPLPLVPGYPRVCASLPLPFDSGLLRSHSHSHLARPPLS